MNNILTKKDYAIFVIISICIIFSFYVSIVAMLGLIIGIIYVLKNENLKGFLLLFFILPFAQVFKISANTTSLYTILEFIMVIKLFKTNPNLKKKFIYCVICFVLYVICVSLIADHFDALKILKLFMGLSLLYFFIDTYRESSLFDITNSMSLGMIISSTIGMFKTSIPGLAKMYNDFNLQYINGLRVTRFSGTFTDPNYYSVAIVINLGLIICCLTVMNKFNLKYTIIGIVLMLLGFLTYSKSYLLMLIFLVLIVMKLLINNKKVIVSLLMISLILLIFVTGIYQKIPIIQSILSRFENSNNIDSLTTGRYEIWKNYISYIKNNNRVFWIGDGIGAPYIIGATHNMYIEIWYYIGLIGIVYYFFSIKGILFHKKINKSKLINFFMLVSVLMMYIFLAGFTAFEFPFYMMVSWIIINTNLMKKDMRGDKK